MLLKNGKILVDFDGVIVENLRPDGTCYYPDFGPIRPGIVNFLDQCKYFGIKVEIWTARTNYTDDHTKFPVYGAIALQKVHEFLRSNHIHYDAILELYKPLGSHSFSWLIDDKSFNPKDGFDCTRFFFGDK